MSLATTAPPRNGAASLRPARLVRATADRRQGVQAELRRRRRQHRDGHQGQDRRRAPRPGRHPVRGPHPLRGRARHRQVDAGPGHRPVDRTRRTSRVQCTPDMLPGDITGSSILDQRKGDVRVPARARLHQRPALRRDQPGHAQDPVGAARGHGASAGCRPTAPPTTCPGPFLVLATQNPIEQAGTFPLPEAQLDRFLFKLSMGYMDREPRVRGHVRQRGAAVDRGPRPGDRHRRRCRR